MNMPIFDGRSFPTVDEDIIRTFPDDPISGFRGQNVIDVLRAVGLIPVRLADILLLGGYDPRWADFGTANERMVFLANQHVPYCSLAGICMDPYQCFLKPCT